MASSSTFRELVHALPDEERKELYRKIMVSLGLTQNDDESRALIRTEIHPDQRRDIISREIAALGPWGRLRLWIRSWLTGKIKEDALVDQKLRTLRKRLVRSEVCVSSSQSELLSEQFAGRLYAMYCSAYPLVPLFSDLWKSKELLRTVVQSVLERRISGSKKRLGDFLSDEEMREIYVNSGSRTEIRNHLLERLDHYIASIHDGVFAEILAGLSPLYHLKNLALYDYALLLSSFGYDSSAAPGSEPPSFSRCRAVAVLDQLEELYHALYVWHRLESKFTIHRELLEYYVQAEPAELSEEPVQQSDLARSTAALERDIKALHEAAREFSSHVPLADLIRYYHEDPYHRLLVYTPRIHLKEFYYSALRVELLGEVDERFPSVRESAITTLIEETFGHQPPEFTHYRAGAAAVSGKGGLPTFRYVRSVNILYNFLQIIFRRVIRPSISSIQRSIPARSREISNELSFFSAGLEDLGDKLHAFDESFSPDSDEGKTLFRVRYSMEKDATQQRIYRSIIAQRDKQARGMLDKGLEYLRGMQASLRKAGAAMSPHREETTSGPDVLIARFSGSLERIVRLVDLIISTEEAPTG
ncbi:MAG: hypothetical protein EA403_06180 [Spirochaetaceae bacterium]|nr:MAG: hypothetical protein EA403_06180 [Spirochaetaceae bacterium]